MQNYVKVSLIFCNNAFLFIAKKQYVVVSIRIFLQTIRRLHLALRCRSSAPSGKVGTLYLGRTMCKKMRYNNWTPFSLSRSSQLLLRPVHLRASYYRNCAYAYSLCTPVCVIRRRVKVIVFICSIGLYASKNADFLLEVRDQDIHHTQLNANFFFLTPNFAK